MPSEGDYLSIELRLQKAMRALREELRLTQVQLGQFVRLTPTSIYRYEAAETFPDTATLVKLWDFAIQQGSQSAIYFSELLAEAVPPLRSLLEKFSSGQEQQIQTAQLRLGSDERLVVLALINMLADSHDPKAIKIINILLEPWMEAAKSQLGQQTRNDAFEGTNLPVHNQTTNALKSPSIPKPLVEKIKKANKPHS